MRPPARSLITRRQLLVGGGATAAALFMSACGDDSVGTTASSATTVPSDAGGSGSLALAQFFGGPIFVAGQPLRAPFGVADADGLLSVDDTPRRLDVQLSGPDGTDLGDPIAVERRSEGLPRAYFPLLATLAEPGIYTARTELTGGPAEMSFQVYDAAEVKVIQPGAAMPALETPTTTDAHGVNPICTRDPVCPLHDVTVAQALADATPMALLVSTPAFCQLAICGPVLEVLLQAASSHAGVKFLHSEVYADPAKDLTTYAPAIAPLGLHFEPCLVLVDGTGKVVDRVDTIYDATELDERLGALA
jgi:hypothetical protein